MLIKRSYAHRTFVLIVIPALLIALIGCSEPGNQRKVAPIQWPPKSPTTEAPSTKASAKFSGSQNLSGTLGVLMTDGEVDLGFNIFGANGPDDQFFRSQYEVTYLAADRTRIKLDPSKRDVLAMDINTRKLNVLAVGTKVRCGDQTYEVKEDGWYVDGKLVHEFQKLR